MKIKLLLTKKGSDDIDIKEYENAYIKIDSDSVEKDKLFIYIEDVS